MTKPTIELRKVQVLVRASEETHCYTADLYVDGVRIAEVGNHGQGGPDFFTPVKDATWDGKAGWEISRHLNERIGAEYPRRDMADIGMPGHSLPESLESLCCDAVNDHLLDKDIKRMTANKIAFYDPERRGIYTFKAAPTEANLDVIRKRHPTVTFLNGLALPEARALLRSVE